MEVIAVLIVVVKSKWLRHCKSFQPHNHLMKQVLTLVLQLKKPRHIVVRLKPNRYQVT